MQLFNEHGQISHEFSRRWQQARRIDSIPDWHQVTILLADMIVRDRDDLALAGDEATLLVVASGRADMLAARYAAHYTELAADIDPGARERNLVARCLLEVAA